MNCTSCMTFDTKKGLIFLDASPNVIHLIWINILNKPSLTCLLTFNLSDERVIVLEGARIVHCRSSRSWAHWPGAWLAEQQRSSSHFHPPGDTHRAQGRVAMLPRHGIGPDAGQPQLLAVFIKPREVDAPLKHFSPDPSWCCSQSACLLNISIPRLTWQKDKSSGSRNVFFLPGTYVWLCLTTRRDQHWIWATFSVFAPDLDIRLNSHNQRTQFDWKSVHDSHQSSGLSLVLVTIYQELVVASKEGVCRQWTSL